MKKIVRFRYLERNDFLNKVDIKQLIKFLYSGNYVGDNIRKKFETSINNYIKSPYSISVSSGTNAIYLSLKCAGIKKNDEVLVPCLSWLSTFTAISMIGAKAIGVDINTNFAMDLSDLKSKITKKTKAILFVHFSGFATDLTVIKKICENKKIILIEDCAQSFGAFVNKRSTGTFGDFGAFSMNPMKVLNGYGENGLVVTNSKKLIKKLTMMRHAGTISNYKKKITNKCYYISLNHKMDSINAAALNVSFENFSKKLKKLNQIANYYDKNLDKRIIKQKLHKGEVHGRYAYPIVFYNKNRNTIMNSLEKDGIQTRIFHSPLAHQTPVYKQNTNRKFNTAEFLEKNSLVIPLHHNLTNNEVKKIVKKINRFF